MKILKTQTNISRGFCYPLNDKRNDHTASIRILEQGL